MRASTTSDTDTLVAVWSDLKAYIARRNRELHDEVRHYPTPIARCDEQLTKLIEQRQRAMHLLELVRERHEPDSVTVERLLLAPAIDADDEGESALRLRLRLRAAQ